jgi:hypothetical protein|tara:strand:+ start:75 stop:302 length:228 start_codon:yes stop_codon:yes gene_type:complete
MPKISEKEIDAIVDQIKIDIGNKDYTAIYGLIERLAELDSVVVTPLLMGFLRNRFDEEGYEELKEELLNNYNRYK